MELAILIVKDLFFTKSVVDFKRTAITENQWAEMRSDPENTFWHAPYPSSSEYLLMRENDRWLIYRRADHWGKISNECNWTLDDEESEEDDDFAIGFANLKDFKF